MSIQALTLIKNCLNTKSTYLDLGNCGLVDIDFDGTSELNNELKKCTHVEKLIFSNEWFLWHFDGTKSIVRSQNDGQKNKITTYPPSISFLSNLSELILGGIAKNDWGIEDIVFIESLFNITRVDLSFNNITDLTSIENLPKLKQVDLSYNKIKDITPLLTYLQRNKDPLKIEVRDINSPGIISINGNPLMTPPMEIVNQGNTAILNYFDEIAKHDFEYLYEAKLLLAGQPRAGKSSLREKLYDISSPLVNEDETTRGIEIKRLNFDTQDLNNKLIKFFYNVWDFGGQQIYQTTHQFFLTQRSLYVLVVDTGKDSTGNDDSNINYWLQIIELLGGNSRTLLIMNEKNGRKINIDIVKKSERFKFLKKYYSLDLNTLIINTKEFNEIHFIAFKHLKEDIETELKHLPLVGFVMPKNWIEIRKELHRLSGTRPYISRQDYIMLCKRYDVIEFEKQMELSRIFHDLGIFLHFQDYSALEDFIILQNVWATDAVFAVFDNDLVQANHGTFTEADLIEIWKHKGYEPLIYHKLLALMMQFELCYQLNVSKVKTYIVPEMLLPSAPVDYNWQPYKDLNLYYKYDFMPKGILTRLIVRLHKYIFGSNEQQMVWKTGVKIDGNYLSSENTYAEITEEWDEKLLSIRIQGENSRDLMSKLTFQIDELNEEFFNKEHNQTQKSKWYKMIPCNCSMCRNSVDKHFYDYNKLQNAKQKVRSIQCPESLEDVNVAELLEGIFSFKKTNKPKKIFISYAHEDEYWKNELVKNLAPLRDQELVSDWNDKYIEAGFWDPQITKEIENADIFLLLITHNFLASPYISSKEIKQAYSNFKSGKTNIFPIICDSCAWQLKPVTTTETEFNPDENKEMYISLGKFQAFPKNAKPIKNWNNQQDAFVDVITQLRKYL